MKTEILNLTNEGVTLTCYIQDVSDEMPHRKKMPAMLVLPGGAYHFCSDREAEPIALYFVSKGYNAFVLRYSIGPGKAVFPKPLNDAEEAMRIIKDNSEDWHTDPERIAAVGFSAGGHLCAMLSVMGSVKPAASILCYPCVTERINEVLEQDMPDIIGKIDSSTPPSFIVASRDDTMVPVSESLTYADALEKNGVPFEMHIYSNGYHGFSLANSLVYSDRNDLEKNYHMSGWTELCSAWLERTIG